MSNVALGATPLVTEPAISSERSHLDALTGLRIFAALAVYASHLPAPKGAPSWILTVQQSGYAGVTFFFVLSGFVLTINYFDRVSTPRQLWSYAVARIARVYPLYLLVLAFPATELWAAHTPQPHLAEHVFALQAWSRSLFIAYDYVGPAWSISVELFLYATLPILVLLIRLIDRRTWQLLGAALAVCASLLLLAFWFQHSGRAALPWTNPASAHRWLYRTPLTRVGDFALGILAARLYERLRRFPQLGVWLTTPALLVTGLFAADHSLLFTAWSWDALYAIPAGALILGLAIAPRLWLSRLLSIPVLVFLGEASYAFYLTHKIVLALVDAGSWSQGLTPATVVLELIHLGMAVALAIGLHTGVERPARIALRRLLDPKPSSASHRMPALGVNPGPVALAVGDGSNVPLAAPRTEDREPRVAP